MNAFVIRAQAYKMLAEEGLSVDSVAKRIRFEHRAALTSVKGTELEALVVSIDAQIREADKPVPKEFLRLSYLELELRGELQEVLSAIEPKSPIETRTLVTVIQKLGSRDISRGLEPAEELMEAVALVDDPQYAARLADLYRDGPAAQA